MLGKLEERWMGADTHILLTRLEEYHRRQLNYSYSGTQLPPNIIASYRRKTM